MTDREKLLALYKETVKDCEIETVCWNCSYQESDDCFVEKLVDRLIANGVTFATDTNDGHKWIPVTERLPEIGCNVLVIDRVTGEVTTAHLNDFNCFVFREGRGHGASHWMPLPEPPKGE